MPSPAAREGDIIVTPVAHHFAIGRITADGQTQQHLASQRHRADALALACRLAGSDHQVFVFKYAGASSFERCDCETLRRTANT